MKIKYLTITSKKIVFYNFLKSFVKSYLFLIIFLITITFITGILEVPNPIQKKLGAETINNDQKEIAEIADKILSDRHCPCQCGNYLPGSAKSPACFGCSVGKAEITHVLESLEAGRKPVDVTMDLMTPVLIEVFSDYTNKNVSQVWKQVKRISNELHQTRVVLRTPGLTVKARRAIKLAECTRLNREFNIMQEALINHHGPWDWKTLIHLASQYSHDTKQIEACLDMIDIEAQIVKDQQHAKERSISIYPTITINRKTIPNTDFAIRKAIERIILEESI